MKNLDIPLRRRSIPYRLFEMLPATLSYGAIILLVVLSLINPLYASIYLVFVAATLLVRAVAVGYHTLVGSKRVETAKKEDWSSYLQDLENREVSLEVAQKKTTYFAKKHRENLAVMQQSGQVYPKPSEIFNAVIIAFYNEPYEVLFETIETLRATTYDSKKIMVILAYEERGGAKTEAIAKRLSATYDDTFYSFQAVKHPRGIANEISSGKGGNITFAGQYLKEYLNKQRIAYTDVIVTTLDSDNRPDPQYFDYLTYEYIVHDHRKNLSFQPVSLFMNNIWDVPAPMRVIATGNSFWNIISAMRPHTLRNFASHAQPMEALVEMNFWSTRTIVEDGHQYWRSYFHFDGDYDVVPLFVPIYQDAVMSNTYKKTLKAQFVQLRRWAYGASDVPYVGVRVFSLKSKVNFFAAASRFVRLLDGHVTLASVPLIITFGAWIPIFLNTNADRSVVANQLPEIVGLIMRIATIGLFVTIFVTFKMLPPRPERYKRSRTVGMLLQWLLMPITAITYSAASAYYSQTRLFLGNYMTTFDVTEKASVLTKEKKS